MNTARLLRQVIPRPKVVPKFGQSTERFIIVDSSQQSFQVPDTECSYSFLLSLSGSRTVDLLPAEECKNQCKTLKVELKETFLCKYLKPGNHLLHLNFLSLIIYLKKCPWLLPFFF